MFKAIAADDNSNDDTHDDHDNPDDTFRVLAKGCIVSCNLHKTLNYDPLIFKTIVNFC
jgi:hypothetical protein